MLKAASLVHGIIGQPKIIILSSFFFSKLYLDTKTSTYDFENVRKQVKKTFFKTDFPYVIIIFPINTDNNHWTLGAINFFHRLILHCDSKGEKYDDYLVKMWRLVQDISKVFDLAIPKRDDWTLENRILKKVQENNDDCGIFTLIYAEQLVADIPISSTSVQQKHCPWYRFKIAHCILKGEIQFEQRGLENKSDTLW
jgi:Ulp1 family protease